MMTRQIWRAFAVIAHALDIEPVDLAILLLATALIALTLFTLT